MTIILILGLIEVGARLSVRGVNRLPAIFAPAVDGSGYRLATGSHHYRHRDRAITVTIDAHGRRRVPGAPDEAPRTLWVIGDSQVFGWGLNDDETIPARLQRAFGADVKVVNAGVPGYGPMAYSRTIREMPEDALALVVFTETNDAQDAYSSETYGMAHCGILVSPGGVGRKLPCWLMRSHLFSTLLDLRNLLFPSRLAPPLNCNPTVRSAAAVIATRVQAVERMLLAQPMPIFTATVPSDARLDPERLADYRPLLDAMTCQWDFPDGLELLPDLAGRDDVSRIFQRRDHHVSAYGAEVIAHHLASTLPAIPAGDEPPIPTRLSAHHRGAGSEP